MSISTFIWACIMAVGNTDTIVATGRLSSLIELLAVGYSLGIVIDWPFVYPAMHGSPNRGIRSLKATLAMQTVLLAVLAAIVFWVHSHPSYQGHEDTSGGPD